MALVEQRDVLVPVNAACDALGVSRASLYPGPPAGSPANARTRPPSEPAPSR